MLFLWIAVLNLQKNNNFRCLIDFSIALSMKMNILLFLPALLMCLNYSIGPLFTIASLGFIIIFQVLIGLPFVLHDAPAYFGKAFEMDRKFFFKWSVNWNFLGEENALNSNFAKLLLVAHLSLLLIFLFFKWAPSFRYFF